MSFYPDEVERITNAELVLLGIQPSELGHMSVQLKEDVLAIGEAKAALGRGKMPGEK